MLGINFWLTMLRWVEACGNHSKTTPKTSFLMRAKLWNDVLELHLRQSRIMIDWLQVPNQSFLIPAFSHVLQISR